jgi:hypothetical protein
VTTIVRIELASHAALAQEIEGVGTPQEKVAYEHVIVPGAQAYPLLYATTTRAIRIQELEPHDPRVAKGDRAGGEEK